MVKHELRADRRRKAPKATIQAAPTVYEITKPAGSAERFLDDAAKAALAAAAAGGLPSPKQFIPGAIRAVAKEAEKYPDPLLAEAAGLPREELLRRAANAGAYQKTMEAQNEVVRAASTALSPAGNMVANQAGAAAHDALTRQDVKGGDTRQAAKSGETFDTPIPKELQAKYDAWYAQLPKNLQYTGDYDLQGAWLERLGQPDKYEAAQNGHLDDYGKKPNHITFSTGSKWHDPKVPERTGGEWKQAKDGSWDFYPGTGNKASDDELKAYFEKYEKGNRVHGREVRPDTKSGKTSLLGRLRKRVGDAGEVIDYGIAWAERQAKETADMGIPVLSKAADIVVSPALVGVRAAVANVASGGGKYYRPETRDERYFSKQALRELGDVVSHMHGRGSGRVDGLDNAGQFNLTQTLGGFTVKDGTVNDKFDINRRYHGVPDALTQVARTVLGREEDPDGGKIHTKIPLRVLTRQDAKGGDAAGPETAVSETPVSETPAQQGGPRIVINPTTFHNKKDALCVTFNEGFRVWMEANDFQPQSEPTDAQRKFFSDTAYADDEVQLRRTILARIATFDTSVKDPTDDQLSETASFLGAVLESGWCKNEWERDSVSRLMNAVQSAVGAEPVEPRQEPLEAREAEPLQRRAAMGGGETEDEEERRRKATQFAEERGMSTESFEDMDIQTVESVYKMHDEQFQGATESPAAQTAETVYKKPGRQSENDLREVVAAKNEAALGARADEHVAAANRTLESLDQHMANADALGEMANSWNKTTDQILAQGEKMLSGGDSPGQAQTEQPGRAVAQRGADGHFHDASGRIVSQRTAQAELDKAQTGQTQAEQAQTGQTQAGQAQTGQPGRAVAQRGADGHFHDASGRIVSQRTAQAELDNGAQAEQPPEQQTASQRIGVGSGVFGPGRRQLTAAEAAWGRRRRRSII